jgi:polar amino acid transport system substrate-binding protein
MAKAAQVPALDNGRRWRWAPIAAIVAIALFGAMLTLLPPGPWRELFANERPFAAAFARGALIVAVPSQPAPILYVGRVDRSVRAPDSYSASLAEDLGRRVGLPVKLLLSEPAEARKAVQAGEADVAIAGLGFAPDASLAFAPTPYSSGRGVALVLRGASVQTQRDLHGRAVCGSRESPFAASAARKLGAPLQSFDRPLDALLAFQAGECAALIDDELVIRALLKQPDWSYYRVLPGSFEAAPAYIAVRGGDLAGAAYVEQMVTDWRQQRWLGTVRQDRATQLAFEMFNAENDLYCH